ncbi:MAG: amidohydrolase [Pleurocapsa minor GSE-CHR-MK-17-07R]|jgi:5-methylthioadenosine/S-adenosylhomocysteine deaminase|nr:amidohydrolase [Pleurocapsa minor GSE-CHR-MK 17-07R]
MAILLTGGMILGLGLADTIYDAGYVVVDGDRIAEVGPAAAAPSGRAFDEVVDFSGRLLMPGLVNAHTHTPMTLFRGLAEGVSLLTMDGWYNTIRLLELAMTADMVPASVEVACAEMIRTGTTTFADQYFFMDQVIPTVERSGLRAALAYGIVELNDPEARDRELAALDGFLETINSGETDRLRGWVGPHAFFVDNSPETMLAERAIAEKYDTGLHIHLSTTGEEDAFCAEHYGTTAVRKMDELGMLERPVIAAHALTIPQGDWGILGECNFTAAIAASACMRAGAEAAPVVGMRAAGINIAMGTDNVCNNNDYDLFLEMRTLAKLASFREGRPGALPARDVLDIATRGGAKALGLEDEIGVVAAGKKADLIVLDQQEIGWAPAGANAPFTALVYSVNGLHVTDTMADGRWLMRERRLTTLDYRAARARQAEDVKRLLALAGRG